MRLPPHRVTTAHLGAAYPFMAEGGLGSRGVYVGQDVLGGGLFSPLTGKLLKIGTRLALVPIIKSQLGALAGTEGERPGESSTH